jgi:hypothetical protein
MTDISQRNALGAAGGNPARTPLPIASELSPNPQGAITLSARGNAVLLSGRATVTHGYNGAFLGPTLRLRRAAEQK